LKPFHAQEVRDKIQGSQLVHLLADVAMTGSYNGEKVAPERLRAAEILLKKVLPDLKAIEHEIDGTMTVNVISYARDNNTQ